MSRYQPRELVSKWAQESLTLEQAVGQILLYLQELVERVELLERQVRALQAGERE